MKRCKPAGGIPVRTASRTTWRSLRRPPTIHQSTSQTRCGMREQEPEEHGEPRAAKIVRIAHEAHWMAGGGSATVQHRSRVGARIPVGDEQRYARPALRSRRRTRRHRAGPPAFVPARATRTSRGTRTRRPAAPPPPKPEVPRDPDRHFADPRREADAARTSERRRTTSAGIREHEADQRLPAPLRCGLSGSCTSIGYRPASPMKPGYGLAESERYAPR